MIPKNKPMLSQDKASLIIDTLTEGTFGEVSVLAIRGYFRDSMGKVGENDRGVYDDAIFIKSSTLFASYNGNTDPSRYRKGFGFGSEKGMAQLCEGIWNYKPGVHYGSVPHQAFRQNSKFLVKRDGSKGQYDDYGMFGINLHRGGVKGTSSLGCQTVPPNQWDSFRDALNAELVRHSQKTFDYILTSIESLKAKGIEI